MSEDTVLRDEEGNPLELELPFSYIFTNMGIEIGRIIEEIWSDIFKNELI